MMSSLRIALLLVAVFSSTLLMGQWNYPEFNMSNATIGNCFGRLYDSGGLTGPYGFDENTTTVINTDGIITSSVGFKFPHMS